MALEIQPVFKVVGAGGLVGMAKAHNRVIGVMLGLYTKLEPNGLSYLKDTSLFYERGRAQGAGGCGQTPPKIQRFDF